MTPPDKSRVVEAFERALRAELAVLAAATASARDEATSGESRPENKYDTRALEASYLAAGQGERLEDRARMVAWIGRQHGHACDRAGEGALLGVRIDGRPRWILLAPRGGPDVVVEGVPVQLVSMDAPLGEALRGLAPGDVAEVERPRGRQEIEVEHVS